MILDEPTNHLDLEACVWLEETLKRWKRILLLVSHSQDFLNGVCTNIINMHQKKLKYYAGGCWEGGWVGGLAWMDGRGVQTCVWAGVRVGPAAGWRAGWTASQGAGVARGG